MNYAHSRPDSPQSEWEPLEVHLTEVAMLAAKFANSFDSAAWGHIAGLWHDLGKYRPQFQDRIRGSRVQVEHAGLGAALASDRALLPLAFVIAGHHAGLANHKTQSRSDRRPLIERLLDAQPVLKQLRATLPAEIVNAGQPTIPAFLVRDERTSEESRLAIELWIRMLFSALVDADRLATERFYNPGARDSVVVFDDLATLSSRLDDRLSRFVADSEVNTLRGEVLADCRAAAVLPPGFFTLTVPTGGGKTLSVMAFALRHSLKQGQRRVITAVPYTTIIEQNALVLRDALGDGNVIEHHSGVEDTQNDDSPSASETEVRRRFAIENWDAPVIVTTTVQLFESLFASHPSRCRKLHNIARSVIVIDEAQTLPPGFLLCILDAMKVLVRDYGCTIVLSTATQPALNAREALPQGLREVIEIATNPKRLQRALRRVRVEWPSADGMTTSYTDIAREVSGHDRVLAVVHLRQDAHTLGEQLPSEGLFHLSALMCPAHRRKTLREMSDALRDGCVCRTVSTQLVEAGVDVDFPVVYRALAGLDSLAQAAGRCNREGRLRDASGQLIEGRFVVFRAETKPPVGVLRRGLEETEKLLHIHGGALDFTDPDIMESYFRGLYWASQLDPKNVQAERALLNFATVSNLVRLIEDGFARPIVVPYESSDTALREYLKFPSRRAARVLQQFVVQVRERDLELLLSRGALEPLGEFGYALSGSFEGLYDGLFGLRIPGTDESSPALIA